MNKRYLVTIIAVSVLVIAILFKLFVNKQHIDDLKEPKITKESSVPVRCASVQQMIDSASLLKNGNISPFKESKIYSTTSGIVQKLNFELGSNVAANQTLAILDARKGTIDLSKAKYKAAKLKRDVETYTELYEGKATTRETLEGIQQDYHDALSDIEQAQEVVSESIIKSPMSGTVSEKLVEAGVFVSAGTELATIVDIRNPKVKLWVTEKEVYELSLGQTVEVTSEIYHGTTFSGKVSFISPQADDARNYLVEITVEGQPTKQLRSGTFVNVLLRRQLPVQLLVVPQEAIIENINEPTVYVANNLGKVSLRKIQIGRVIDKSVEVISGLSKGEMVVVTGQINLRDGATISVIK